MSLFEWKQFWLHTNKQHQLTFLILPLNMRLNDILYWIFNTCDLGKGLHRTELNKNHPEARIIGASHLGVTGFNTESLNWSLAIVDNVFIQLHWNNLESMANIPTRDDMRRIKSKLGHSKGYFFFSDLFSKETKSSFIYKYYFQTRLSWNIFLHFEDDYIN